MRSKRGQLPLYPVTNYQTPGTPSYEDNAEGYRLTHHTMKWSWAHYLNDEQMGLRRLGTKSSQTLRTEVRIQSPPAKSQQQTRFRYPGMKAPGQAEDASGQQHPVQPRPEYQISLERLMLDLKASATK